MIHHFDKIIAELTEEKPSAKVCSICGKLLSESKESTFYTNGQGVCSNLCKNKLLYSSEIELMNYEYLKPLYLKTDMEKLPCLQKSKKALEWALGSIGLILVGETGTGKTRTLTMLLRRLFEEHINELKNSTEIFYAGKLKDAILDSHLKKEHSNFMSKLQNCRLLVVDDFGKEKFTETFEADIFEIINGRIEREKPTIITTNANGTSLRAKFSDVKKAEPFIRRLNEFFLQNNTN